MYHSYTIYYMTEEKAKSQLSTSVRISIKTKERLKNVAREMAAKERRTVTELELVDGLVTKGLPKLERKLGL